MKESTSWILFMFAAIIIVVFLGIHMFIMHLDTIVGSSESEEENVMKFDSVTERSKSTFFMVTYIMLLAAALYHGLYGLRTIIFELNIKKPIQKMTTIVLSIVGLFLFVFGTWVLIASFTG